MSNNKTILRSIMFVGTGSDTGKSIVNTAFCRIFHQDGLQPAPFKAQNMSLNSYATPEGLEIGRAQATQAEACSIECSSDMNPVLLKPNNYMEAQVVLNGKVTGNQSAQKYFSGEGRQWLFEQVMEAYNRLAKKYSPIVIEGAGSISELNLRDRDITNMRVAMETGAATYLVADIDRGGVFGSIYGTIELLKPGERKQIKGIIINKFRGDPALFEEGKKMIEELTGIPVVSILPYFNDIHIDNEDSVALDNKERSAKNDKVNIAVVLLRHMSNFTDFDVLERTGNVHLYYAARPEDLDNADIIIIPGSKNVMSDMIYLRNKDLAKKILQHHDAGKAVYGICGGYQMMGKTISDPNTVEGDTGSIPGLGILPVTTVLKPDKVTEQCTFTFLDHKDDCKGYEIHMGETARDGGKPLCSIEGKNEDGCFINPKTWGTYIHGIFDNTPVLSYILKNNGNINDSGIVDHKAFKQEQYDKLADLVRKHTDMDYIYGSLT